MDRVISGTVPAPQDTACEVHSVFCERPQRARLREGIARHLRRLRDARSESRVRHDWARLHCKPRGAVRVRMISPGIMQHEGRVSNARWLTWRMARKRALGAINRATSRFKLSANGRGRASCKPPPWRCKAYRAFARVADPWPGCSEHPRRGQRSTS